MNCIRKMNTSKILRVKRLVAKSLRFGADFAGITSAGVAIAAYYKLTAEKNEDTSSNADCWKPADVTKNKETVGRAKWKIAREYNEESLTLTETEKDGRKGTTLTEKKISSTVKYEGSLKGKIEKDS